MTFRKALHSSGVIALVSGVLHIIAALVIVVSFFAPVIPDAVFTSSLVLANVLDIFVFMAVFGVQLEAGGTLGAVGFGLAASGHLLALSNFYAPSGSILLTVGILLLAIATLLSGKLTHWPLWMWFAGAVITLTFVMLGVGLAIGAGLLLLGAARVWLGVALIARATHQPDLAASMG